MIFIIKTRNYFCLFSGLFFNFLDLTILFLNSLFCAFILSFLSFKKALIKKEIEVQDVEIGKYIFDGKFTYSANTVSYQLVTNDNDNRLRIIILEDENNQKYIDKDVEVLFEEKDESGYYKGHTQNYILVEYKSSENLENKIKEENVMSFYEDDEDDIDLPSLK